MGRYCDIVNKTKKQLKLKSLIEEAFLHTNVEVWWEPLVHANEMCGPTGGFFFCSDQTEICPLGPGYKYAIATILHAPDVRIKPLGKWIDELTSYDSNMTLP